jgi:hypothetical protein
MGFTGKAGALIGVALDLSGNFSGGPEFANHVTVRESGAPIGENIASVQYKPQQLSTTDEEWRSVLVKFDIDGTALARPIASMLAASLSNMLEFGCLCTH